MISFTFWRICGMVEYIPCIRGRNMSMVKKIGLSVILVCFVFIITILFNGCGDNWVEVGGNEYNTYYYKPSSVNIEIQNKTIKVWTKSIESEKGLKSTMDIMKDIAKFSRTPFNQDYYNNFGYNLFLYVFDYKEWKYTINQRTGYSKSGDVLDNKEIPTAWKNIESGTIESLLLRQLIREYNIKM
jgi:hypothetical protein